MMITDFKEDAQVQCIKREMQAWRAAVGDSIQALESFAALLKSYASYIDNVEYAQLSDADFKEELRNLTQNGLEGWFDLSPLGIDKLRMMLVEGKFKHPEPWSSR